jgi:hypothetical protein
MGVVKKYFLPLMKLEVWITSLRVVGIIPNRRHLLVERIILKGG